MTEVQIENALAKFKQLLIEQDARNQKIKSTKEFKDFKYLGVKLPTGRTVLLYIVSALLSAAIIYISSIIR
jgi:hypothetical protein